jgi:hypothetical protein
MGQDFYFSGNGGGKDKKSMDKTIAEVGGFDTGAGTGAFKVDALEYNSKEETKKAVIDAYNLELEGYNSGLVSIDADYGGVKLCGYEVMVRVFAIGVRRSDKGLYMFRNAQVPIPAKSGQGVLTFVDSPYNYSHRAVVVNVSGSSKFKVGDIVQLNDLYLKATTPGNPDSVVPIFGYASWEYLDKHFTADCKVVGDKNFGYMLMPEQNINVVLKGSGIMKEV